MVIFALLGALMFCSKIIMEALPNIHLLGMFTMVFALAYRKKGLIPLYVYVFINGVWAGFDIWWMPYDKESSSLLKDLSRSFFGDGKNMISTGLRFIKYKK